MSKKELGQFFTTNYEYILQNLNIPDKINIIIEPFCGNCDLLKWNKINKDIKIELYDIDPKNKDTIKQDTINNPPSYKNKFILTNPPYLARNKSTNKVLYDKYNVNDLYKCFIKELLTNVCLGGILIIPLNFLSSIRKSDISLRKCFLNIYKIKTLNIFEQQVFNDTSYTICSFQFELHIDNIDNSFLVNIYPNNKVMNVVLNNNNNYTIGGDIYNLNIQTTNFTVFRLTNSEKLKTYITNKTYSNIIVKCIDDSEQNQINLSFSNIPYIDSTPNLSARTYATLVIEPQLTIEQEKLLIKNFNDFLNKYRSTYNSLFLTNYRESKNNNFARKRISFDLVYNIVQFLLQ
jgi:hypothetical protein